MNMIKRINDPLRLFGCPLLMLSGTDVNQVVEAPHVSELFPCRHA